MAASVWGALWAMIAAAAGLGLAAAATALFRRRGFDDDPCEFFASYNALAPLLDHGAFLTKKQTRAA